MSNSNVTTLDSAAAAPRGRAAAAKVEQDHILKPTSGSGDFSGEFARIRIAVEPNSPGGKDAVFLGVAGTGFLVPRGKNWIVPVELANVLRDANHTTYERDENDKRYERVDSPRFSYTAENLDDETAQRLLSEQREKIADAA